MKITYHGNTTFSIKGKNTFVMLDPKDSAAKADLALHSSKEHTASEAKSMIDWPGEYEMQEVLVHGEELPFGDNKTIIYNFEIDDVKVLFLPNLDHVLGEALLEKMGDADVLLLPVGGAGALDAKTASKVFEEIDPKIIIPMQHSEGDYAPIGDFLKEVGKVGKEFEDSLTVTKASLPLDATEFHVLSTV